MALTDLKSLLTHELQDLYSAENQTLAVMPRIAEKVTSDQLRKGMDKHMKETQKQTRRLEKALGHLGSQPGKVTCKAMEGLVKECNDLLKEKADPEVLDAAIVVALQKVEHYEIAGYGSAATFAEQLGLDKVYALLTDTLDEEERQDKQLTRVARKVINVRAAE